MSLLVDGMNVIGSRPDGWWSDRPGAMRTLVAALDRHGRGTGERLTVVFDGEPREMPDAPGVEVVFAPGGPNAADREIARMAKDGDRVVTSDRELAQKVRGVGAEVVPAGAFRRLLDDG